MLNVTSANVMLECLIGIHDAINYTEYTRTLPSSSAILELHTHTPCHHRASLVSQLRPRHSITYRLVQPTIGRAAARSAPCLELKPQCGVYEMLSTLGDATSCWLAWHFAQLPTDAANMPTIILRESGRSRM